MTIDEDPAERRPAKVVVLAGPSGCGKTHLAKTSGLPILTLDDFYRDGTEPDMPRHADGIIDWEDPRTWNADAAVNALEVLCREQRVEIPVYVFGEDRATGVQTIHRGDASIVIAEGIFAAEIIGALRERGLLSDALLIHQNRWLTFVRRLVRDLKTARKARTYLFRQGWAKTRAEPAVVARQRRLGARVVSKAAGLARLRELATADESGSPIASNHAVRTAPS